MGDEAMATIRLGNDLVKPIIEAKINEAILEAMKGSDHIITQTVFAILNLKVDGSGKVNNYSSENRYTFIHHLVNQCIRGAAEQAIKEYVSEKQPEIKAAITKQLESKSGQKDFASALMLAVAETIKDTYRMNVGITFGNPNK